MDSCPVALAWCWAFSKPLLNWVDLTHQVYFREGAWDGGKRVVWEEIKDAILLTTLQTAKECLLSLCSRNVFIHSLIQQIFLECLLLARHYIWGRASTMNKNSISACPKELCSLHGAWWMTCRDLISNSRSMVNKPCLIMCWNTSVFWRRLGLLWFCCEAWALRWVLPWEAPATWLPQWTKTASVRQENHRQLCNGCVFLYTRPLKVSLLEPNETIRYIYMG